MAGRDDYRGYRSEWEEQDRRRREYEREADWMSPAERRTFERAYPQESRYGRAQGHRGEPYGQSEPWRSERSGARYDQDRARYGRGGRPEWQDRDWQGGSPGLSGGNEEYRSRSYRADRPEDFGYGGQEYGIEAHSEFDRQPEALRRVTEGDGGRWRDRFGDDGRPHPRFSDEERDRDRDYERRFGRRDEREPQGRWGREPDRDRGHRYAQDEDRGRSQWRNATAAYAGRDERGGADYGERASRDPFEAADSRRRQEEIRRREDEERRRRADLDRRREDEQRHDLDAWSRGWEW